MGERNNGLASGEASTTLGRKTPEARSHERVGFVVFRGGIRCTVCKWLVGDGQLSRWELAPLLGGR